VIGPFFCGRSTKVDAPAGGFSYVPATAVSDENSHEAAFISRRLRMVDEQIARRGVRDSAVLAAMRTVPRHLFVPPEYIDEAYQDCPLPIGHEQTISQPYIVGSMTEHLNLSANSRVLEVGTGSGYQSAVLAEIVREVFTVEVIPELHDRACELLDRLGYGNITARLSDGSGGWPEHAPYDGIIVTAAAPQVPAMLTEQLAPSGRLVIPLSAGNSYCQELYLICRTPEGITKHFLYDVRFVPMRGQVEE